MMRRQKLMLLQSQYAVSSIIIPNPEKNIYWFSKQFITNYSQFTQ